MRILLIVCTLVAPLVSHAQFGWFGGGEPPAEFMDAPLTTDFLSGRPNVDLTVRELVHGLSMSADGECEAEWDNGDGSYLMFCPMPLNMGTVEVVFVMVWAREENVVFFNMGVGQSQLPHHEIEAWLDLFVRKGTYGARSAPLRNAIVARMRRLSLAAPIDQVRAGCPVERAIAT